MNPATDKINNPIVKTYYDTPEHARKLFASDAAEMAKTNYYPNSEQWQQDSWGCINIGFAILLTSIGIGLLILIYMLLSKPKRGKLIVTYIYNAPSDIEKTCPRCAETVKVAAKACKHCGHEFETISDNLDTPV